MPWLGTGSGSGGTDNEIVGVGSGSCVGNRTGNDGSVVGSGTGPDRVGTVVGATVGAGLSTVD